MIRWSGSHVITRSIAAINSRRTVSISVVKSPSLRIGSFGMWIRPKWFVTPRGRIASNSGCTAVLVLGAMTPNFMRQPSASATSPLPSDDPCAALAKADRHSAALSAVGTEYHLVAIVEKSAGLAG